MSLAETQLRNNTAAEPLRGWSTDEVRRFIRSGQYTGQTAGLSPGYLQGNLAVLPSACALDFLRFCQRNPKPCPLVGVSDTGNPAIPALGHDLDIRTDLPGYNIYHDGKLRDQRRDITELWNEDLVAFVLGCSFSFEEALMAEGIPVRHIDHGRTVSMYRTSVQTIPAGPFSGEMIVSMRPMLPADAIRACVITSRFPHAHGAPIHVGDPAAIGVKDINSPDWGDRTVFKDQEIPVFWACGVTTQIAIQSAKIPVCITHTPGHMLVTDIPTRARVERDRQP